LAIRHRCLPRQYSELRPERKHSWGTHTTFPVSLGVHPHSPQDLGTFVRHSIAGARRRRSSPLRLAREGLPPETHSVSLTSSTATARRFHWPTPPIGKHHGRGPWPVPDARVTWRLLVRRGAVQKKEGDKPLGRLPWRIKPGLRCDYSAQDVIIYEAASGMAFARGRPGLVSKTNRGMTRTPTRFDAPHSIGSVTKSASAGSTPPS
jgi:hypothetical protein